ncbi:MAG: hypothetical protein ABEJ81_05120 [Haloferacaceae archaeon]
MSDERAAASVVGKALESVVLVLLIGVLATMLFGGVLPGYRTAAGAEVADRTLAGAAGRIDRAVPDGDPWGVDRELRVDLPDTIRGRRYELRATGRTLVLDHPAAGIGGRARLDLPAGVRASGTWASDTPAVVRVRGDRDGLRVRLVAGPNAVGVAGANGGGRP